MPAQTPESARLLEQIDAVFIDSVGPIGDVLIEDVRALWRRKGWRGPAALRHYINALAAQIEQPAPRKRFVERTSQLVYEARSRH